MRARRAVVVLATCGTVVLAPAAADASPRTYSNCTQMHQDYKGGVARSGAQDRRANGGHARYAPYVNTGLYNANAKSDRDKDGVACEQ